VGLAGGRGGAARVLGRGRQVRGGPAPGHRRRARRLELGSCSRLRRGVLRRPRADARADRDHRHGRRPQGVADPSRLVAGRQGRLRRRGRCDRGSGAVGRSRARPAVRPPRDSGRRHRHVRRPTRPASAAGCPQPFPGTRGAARIPASGGIGTAPCCGPAGSASGSKPRACAGAASPCCRRARGADCACWAGFGFVRACVVDLDGEAGRGARAEGEPAGRQRHAERAAGTDRCARPHARGGSHRPCAGREPDRILRRLLGADASAASRSARAADSSAARRTSAASVGAALVWSARRRRPARPRGARGPACRARRPAGRARRPRLARPLGPRGRPGSRDARRRATGRAQGGAEAATYH
jgi:hypothetical protein